ncbi:MAG: hypothetical protein ACD_19C00093G0002 [uncultured bacterium]|nr:MAG: hypothetical protein ACD_19C00093G0002 [uncultured bacterium]
MYWLSLLTDLVNGLVKKWSDGNEPIDDVKKLFADKFAELWGNSIQSGSKEDVRTLKNKLDKILWSDFLQKANIKEGIQRLISLRLEQLKSQK